MRAAKERHACYSKTHENLRQFYNIKGYGFNREHTVCRSVST